jgi:hypothetical protein
MGASLHAAPQTDFDHLEVGVLQKPAGAPEAQLVPIVGGAESHVALEASLQLAAPNAQRRAHN